MCNRWVEVSTAHHNQLKAHFQQFDVLTLNSKGNKLWKGVWVSIIRNIWDHRNKIVFRQGKVDVEEIFTMAQLNAWTWIKYKIDKVNFSYSDWILCPIQCLHSVT